MTIEAMKQALGALEKTRDYIAREFRREHGSDKAIKALHQAIAEAEKQEPVAYDIRCDNCGGDGYDPKDNNYSCSSCEGAGFLEKLFYTHPQPKREWVGLTDDEIEQGCKESWVTLQAWQSAVWWAEEKLKEKNT
jgi:hypothetical protein